MLPTRMLCTLNVHWNLLKMYNLDPEPFFRDIGIAPDSLRQPGVRCEVEQGKQLWEAISQAIDDPCFGLKADEAWHPSDLSALGYAVLASKTLEDTFTRINRYQFAVIGEYILRTRRTASKYIVTIIDDLTPSHFSSDDAILSIILSICRINFRSPLFPEQVTLRHKKPSCSEDYYNLFGPDVSFETAESSISFSLEDVRKSLPNDTPYLVECSDKVLLKYMDELDHEDFIERVKINILRHLSSGQTTEEQVAKDFCMSTRNFQKKLQEKGVNYREILQETRFTLAKYYLKDNTISLAEIAFILGYSCTASFSRAFSSWTGTPPKQYKKQFSDIASQV